MTADHIRISGENPWYWAYDGDLVLLLGASDNDCLFQWTGDRLTDHLDDLVSVGGNYVRNTMSIRTDGAAHPFATVEGDEETYDLDEWNDEYWDRLETFLEETRRRDIVVELTLWDQHDFGSGLWELQPWNPENNVNYGPATGLDGGHELFKTVEYGVDEALAYQEAFVEKLLDVSLPFGNVVYNVNNESTVPYKIDDPRTYDSSWERHWARFVRDRAEEEDVHVDVANMLMQPHHSVAAVLEHPDLYSYVELSQLNQDSQGRTGQDHWDTLQEYRVFVETAGARPLNTVKLYGAVDPNPSAGSADEAIDRFWRLVLGGGASARFHRPGTYGLGLVDRTRASIRAMRLLEAEVDLFAMHPANDRIPYADDDEAYCAAVPGEQYAVYFPDGDCDEVAIDLVKAPDEARLRWLDVDGGEWRDEVVLADREHEWVDVAPPGGGKWALAIRVD